MSLTTDTETIEGNYKKQVEGLAKFVNKFEDGVFITKIRTPDGITLKIDYHANAEYKAIVGRS